MKRLLLAALLVPGVASANLVKVEYWGTVLYDYSGGGREGNAIHGRFVIDTLLAPPGEFQGSSWALYESHGDAPPDKDSWRRPSAACRMRFKWRSSGCALSPRRPPAAVTSSGRSAFWAQLSAASSQ
jgi:hypothetical protein